MALALASTKYKYNRNRNHLSASSIIPHMAFDLAKGKKNYEFFLLISQLIRIKGDEIELTLLTTQTQILASTSTTHMEKQ